MRCSLTKLLLLSIILVAGGVAAEAATVTLKTPLDSTASASAETNYGDLVADAMRAAGGADAAFVPATELRDVSLPVGDVDTGKLVGVLRAASDPTDTVFTLHLTGDQVVEALERSVSRAPGGYDGFLQVSGIQFTYNAASTDSVRIRQVTIGGKLVSPQQTYVIATSRMLADGSVGYFEVWRNTASPTDTGVAVSKALTDFSVAHAPIDYHVEGRILGQ